MQQNHTAACLVVTVFANGVAQRLKRVRRTKYEICLDHDAHDAYKKTSKLDISIAYTLRTLPKSTGWEQSLVNALQLRNAGERLSTPEHSSSARLRFSPHETLDFMIRRNLQHILSVCSIPVTCVVPDPETGIQREMEAIALTCGDVSGHRISSAASFFAFQFLAYVYEYLQLKLSGSPQTLLQLGRLLSQQNGKSGLQTLQEDTERSYSTRPKHKRYMLRSSSVALFQDRLGRGVIFSALLAHWKVYIRIARQLLAASPGFG